MKSYRKRTGKKDETTDEFLGFTERVKFYVAENTVKAYTMLGVAGAVLVLTVVGSTLMDQSSKNQLSRQAQALKYYDLETPAPDNAQMSPDQRFAKAKELFGETASGPYAAVSTYYEANAEMEMNDLDSAIAHYRKLAEDTGKDAVVASLAKSRLAAALKMKGDYQGAMEVYKSMSTDSLMKDEGHYMLAMMHEVAGENSAALAEYKTVATEFPNSPWNAAAENKVSELGPNDGAAAAPATDASMGAVGMAPGVTVTTTGTTAPAAPAGK